MPGRKAEPWESGAVAPFLSIDTEQGAVEVSALGEDRFRITAPGGHEQIVIGFDEAEQAADALAERFKQLSGGDNEEESRGARGGRPLRSQLRGTTLHTPSNSVVPGGHSTPNSPSSLGPVKLRLAPSDTATEVGGVCVMRSP